MRSVDLSQVHTACRLQVHLMYTMKLVRKESYIPKLCSPSKVNIWSHLLGSLLFAFLLVYSHLVFSPRYHKATAGDATALAIYFSGVVICFVLSTLCVLLPPSGRTFSLMKIAASMFSRITVRKFTNLATAWIILE